MQFKPGGYHDWLVSIGPQELCFSTDLLNQILFAERSFRSELTFLLERLAVARPTSSLPASKPIHFNLTLQGEGAPWLSITASASIGTAVRFTIDAPSAVLTNRILPAPPPPTTTTAAAAAAAASLDGGYEPATTTTSEGEGDTTSTTSAAAASIETERLFGRAKVQLNVTLGQLCKVSNRDFQCGWKAAALSDLDLMKPIFGRQLRRN